MANIFLNIPLPAGDGAGASIDTSTMGKEKSIVVGGSFEGASIAIEVSTDGGATFQVIWLFTAAGKKVLLTASEFMRARVLGRNALAFTATVDVGANDNGALFLDIPVPASVGAGTAVDVSTLGNFTTFVVNGSFPGTTISIEVSEDGTSYAPCAVFSGQGGVQNRTVVANFVRAFVRGQPGPYAATVAIGATNDPGSGGGEVLPRVLTFWATGRWQATSAGWHYPTLEFGAMGPRWDEFVATKNPPFNANGFAAPFDANVIGAVIQHKVSFPSVQFTAALVRNRKVFGTGGVSNQQIGLDTILDGGNFNAWYQNTLDTSVDTDLLEGDHIIPMLNQDLVAAENINFNIQITIEEILP